MLSEKMLKALNEQIAKEWYSGYLYMSMTSYFEVESLPGMASWMKVQAQEEGAHGMIFFNYVSEQGYRAILDHIKAPPTDFTSPLDVFRKGLEHEKTVTASIHNLMAIAEEEKDYTTRQFLQWFIEEQLEEESSFSELVGRLEKLPEEGGQGLFFLDNQLSSRVFTMPSPLVKA